MHVSVSTVDGSQLWELVPATDKVLLRHYGTYYNDFFFFSKCCKLKKLSCENLFNCTFKKKKPNFIKSFLTGFHWKLCFQWWYNFLRKGRDTVVLPTTALSARLPEKFFFCLMARFKPGTFSVHFFFCSCLIFSFSPLKPASPIGSFPMPFFWLHLKLGSFSYFVSPVAPSLLVCCRREDCSSQKQSESDSQHTAHTRKGCLWVSATRHSEQTGAKSSHSGIALALQIAWIHDICLSRSGGFLTNYIEKALLTRSLLL